MWTFSQKLKLREFTISKHALQKMIKKKVIHRKKLYRLETWIYILKNRKFIEEIIEAKK